MSPQNGILKMIFLFPREDMWVPWRVLLYSYCIWYWGFEMHEAHTIPIHPSIPSLDFTWQSRPSRRYICLWGTTIHHDESHSSHVFWPLEGSCPPSNSSSIFFFLSYISFRNGKPIQSKRLFQYQQIWTCFPGYCKDCMLRHCGLHKTTIDSLHPRKLTWNPKTGGLQMFLLFKGVFSGSMLVFGG